MRYSAQQIRVSNRVVECGSDAWQIANIAHVTTQQVNFQFKDGKPKYDYKLIFQCLAAEIIIVLILINIEQSRNILFFGASFIPIAIVFFSIRKTKNLLRLYYKIINTKVFELIIQTNAATKCLFRSDDYETINDIRNFIVQAMNASGVEVNRVFNRPVGK
jgi:hypothetical protein